jgi:hypothetical protein
VNGEETLSVMLWIQGIEFGLVSLWSTSPKVVAKSGFWVYSAPSIATDWWILFRPAPLT